MASHSSERELSQWARLLFDAVARKWYGAIALELVAGSIGATISIIDLGKISLVLAGIAAVFLLIAYALHLSAEAQYDTAETMRRQSVFAEGLGWPVGPWQMNEWHRRVGKSIRHKAEHSPRPEDYFETQATAGPIKLMEITEESAFFTHHLYCKILDWIKYIVVGAVVFVAFSLFLAIYLSDNSDELIGRLVYAILPILVGADLLGWWLRLNRAVGHINKVQEGFAELTRSKSIDEPQVLRLVAEYDNVVAAGIPIHNWLFNRWHPEIRDLWDKRAR